MLFPSNQRLLRRVRRARRRLNQAHHQSSIVKFTRICLISSGVADVPTIATAAPMQTFNTSQSAMRWFLFGQRQLCMLDLNFTLLSYLHFSSLTAPMEWHIIDPPTITYSINLYSVSSLGNILARGVFDMPIPQHHHPLCPRRDESIPPSPLHMIESQVPATLHWSPALLHWTFPWLQAHIYLAACCDACLGCEVLLFSCGYCGYLIWLTSPLPTNWTPFRLQIQWWLWWNWLGCKELQLYWHVCISQWSLLSSNVYMKCTSYCHSLLI